jgi:mevalonate kinase
LPARLKEVFTKLGNVSDERLREAVELAKKLGLFKVTG